MTERCCDDIAVHSHDGGVTMRRNGAPYAYRHEFRWRRPRFTWYRTASRHRPCAHLNRYPGVVIGAEVVVGRRALGLLWGRAGRVVEIPA